MKTMNTAAQLLLIRLQLMCMPENIINQTDPCSHPAQLKQPDGGYLKISFDHSGPVQHPWSSSSQEECSEVTVRFAERGSLRMRALVSFPRSGNTWLRWVGSQVIFTAWSSSPFL